MSGDENSPTTPAHRRRSSFTANKLSEMFNSARNPNASGNNGPQSNSPPAQNTPVFPNAATARRLSVTATLGLSGSAPSSGPNSATGTGPSGGLWGGLRRGSVSASNASSTSEESAIDESGDAAPPPSPSLGRRVSFGARAMGQMRQNEGFNWADNIRNRQNRSGSVGGPLMGSSAARNEQMQAMQDKAPQPPKAAPPPPAPSALKKERPAPDHFQERILKGDFYMD